jgi:2,4-dienoyl-CoA reductase-like NADH-dependent reductase (Old Yellow Enzyme family)
MSKFNEKFTFNNGVEIKNPVCLAPMTTYSGAKDKFFSDEEIAYYKERSKDVGLIITGCASVKDNGYGFQKPFTIEDDSLNDKYAAFAADMKEYGAKVILQVFHAGRMGLREELGDKPMVSASAVPALRPGAETPKEMTGEEVVDMIQCFKNATIRGIKAGFDGVELHGANTFLIQQFFSPHSNRREDEWGGSLEKRARFPLAVVQAAKEAAAENGKNQFVIGYRISLEELEKPGITLQDSLYLIDELIKAGVDYIHLSLKKGYAQGSIIDTEDKTPLVKSVLDKIAGRVPLMGVSDIFTKEDLEGALNMGYDLVAIGKAMIINPRWLDLIVNNKPVKMQIPVSEVKANYIPSGVVTMIEGIPSWKHVIDFEN